MSSVFIRKLVLALLFSLSVFFSSSAAAEARLINVEVFIGPATADHMIRGLDQVREAGAELVVLRIDTPRWPGQRYARD